MSKEKRFALKQRVDKIHDVAFDRIERIVLEDKIHRVKVEDTLGRIAGAIADASNSIDDAIDYIVR